ncbi:MAG: sterol desaturase family protein [Pseudomonadota bacterium]
MTETVIRLSIFFGLFAAVALWEWQRPRRALAAPKGARWATNWGVSLLDAVMVKLVFGAAAVGAALDAEAGGIGLFHSLAWPPLLEGVLVFVVLDLAIWFQHWLSHRLPVLWRLHKVHHSDRDMDVTTAIRFHPVEIALSMVFKIGLVYALGAPAWAVVAFEVVLNGSAMFNHGNVRLPTRLDRWLRLVIVTPDMHRVHHSVIRAEHDTNFGFNLSLWDRIFGTYTAQPARGHAAMQVGLTDHQDLAPTRLLWTLWLPFRRG